MSNPSQEPNWQRTAWMVVALLWPVALLNYMDRQMLAAMKFSVMQDIPDIGSEANWGLLPAVFKWVYAFLSPVGGYIADRFSKRWVICISLAVWSVITWTTGHVHTFNELLVTRALMGISEAFYIPAALALIADYHLGETRSRAVGVHQMAIYVGIILGGFSGYVADNPQLTWRFAFDAAGVVGVLYAIPLAFLLRRAAKPPVPQATGEDVSKPSPLRAMVQLLGNPAFLLLVVCFTLPAIPGWVVKDWMPVILKDLFNLSQGKAGVYATLFVNLACLGGAFLGGYLADRWMKRTIRGRVQLSALGIALLIPALIGVANATSPFIAICALTLFGLGWGFFDCNNMPILCQITRPELRATGYGIMNMVSISIGGMADVAFGKMRDQGIPLNIIFTSFAAAAAVAVACMLLIRPRTN